MAERATPEAIVGRIRLDLIKATVIFKHMALIPFHAVMII